MSPTPHQLIRGNNRLWRLLYYDELRDTPHWQASHLASADLGFYNCAQAVSRFEPEPIEAFFAERHLAPAVYLDPQAPPDLAATLAARGYQAVPGELENWLGLKLEGAPLGQGDPAVRALRDGDEAALRRFWALDTEANELPKAVAARLLENLRARRDEHLALAHFTLDEGGQALACGSVAVSEGLAFLAEGGTRAGFRRRGLYRRVTLARLRWARAHGAAFACFTAAAAAASNPAGEHLGFRRLFQREYWRR